MRKTIIAYLARSPVSTLIAMTICFLLFGYFSINIFVLLQANIELIRSFGVRALSDGAARQFIEIVINGFASILFFSGWKVCERLIVNWVTRD